MKKVLMAIACIVGSIFLLLYLRSYGFITSTGIFLFLLFGAAWYFTGYRIIRENEIGGVVRLGKPIRPVQSGLRHIWWPIEKIIRGPKTVIKIELDSTVIITAKGEEHSAINLTIKPTLYFRWPQDEGFLETIQVIKDINDVNSLTRFFQGAIFGGICNVGSNMTYVEIKGNLSGFTKRVLEALSDESGSPFNQARIPRDTMQLVIKDPEIPNSLLEAIPKPEIASLEKRAEITMGEAEKQRIILRIEGEAEGRKRLYEAIGNEPANIQKEALLTLREMAKGTSNTIMLVSSQVTNALEDIFGIKKSGGVDLREFIAGLSDGQKKFLQRLLDGMIDKEGSK